MGVRMECFCLQQGFVRPQKHWERRQLLSLFLGASFCSFDRYFSRDRYFLRKNPKIPKYVEIIKSELPKNGTTFGSRARRLGWRSDEGNFFR
jgi:hypothetical protein